MARAGSKKWVWVSAAVLGCLIVALVIALRPPARPEAEVVFIEADKVLKEPNRLQRWVGALRSKLAGQRAVMMGAEIVSTDRLSSLKRAAEVIGRKPLTEREGVHVWLLSQDDLERVVEKLVIRRTNLVANPRLMVNDGQPGSVFIGRSVQIGGTNVDVGLGMRMKALRGETNTDLFLGITDTEVVTRTNEVTGAAVRKNIQIGARVQLPAQQHVLFVCDRKDGQGPVCVFVSAGWKP